MNVDNTNLTSSTPLPSSNGSSSGSSNNDIYPTIPTITSPFLLLADNVNNPFNEYILVLVNYGIVGFCCLMASIVAVFKRLLLLDEEKRIILSSCTVVLLVVSFFSYPFSNPFVWVVSTVIIMIVVV